MQTSLTRSLPQTTQRIAAGVLFAALFAALVWASHSFLPFEYSEGQFTLGVDWYVSFRPAAIALWQGQNPYLNAIGVFNPPWLFALLGPVALLPVSVGAAFMFVFGAAAYAFILWRMGAEWWVILLFAFGPLALDNSGYANVDSLCLLGVLMPPQLGLFFVLMKPQIGIGIALFWLVEAWRRGGVLEVLRVFAPVTIALALSFIPWALWFAPALSWKADITWNTSLWPLSIPIGAALLVSAIRRRQPGLAISAGPFFAPYVAVSSWAVALVGLNPRSVEFKAALIVLWGLRLAGMV